MMPLSLSSSSSSWYRGLCRRWNSSSPGSAPYEKLRSLAPDSDLFLRDPPFSGTLFPALRYNFARNLLVEDLRYFSDIARSLAERQDDDVLCLDGSSTSPSPKYNTLSLDSDTLNRGPCFTRSKRPWFSGSETARMLVPEPKHDSRVFFTRSSSGFRFSRDARAWCPGRPHSELTFSPPLLLRLCQRTGDRSVKNGFRWISTQETPVWPL